MTSEVEQDRQKQLERLYIQSYSYILDLALADKRLLPQDGERIAQSVAAHLDSYGGPLDTESFQQWIVETVSGAVERLGFFIELRERCRNSVRAGIWSILAKNLDLKDHTSTAFIMEQIEADTWAWAWHHLDGLMVPGTAKLSTRLQSQGRFQALTWRKSRLRDNERFDRDVDVYRFGNEPFQADDNLPTYFSPDDDADDGEPRHWPKRRPILPLSDSLLAMKSGRPRLLCQLCKSLQSIAPDPASEPDAVKLLCGHERPGVLGSFGLESQKSCGP